MRLVASLKHGEKLTFGGAIVDDEGIELPRHLTFKTERAYFKWGKIKRWSADGSFCLASSEDKKCNIALSYIHVPNAHLLETIIDLAAKNFRGTLSASIGQ